MLQPSQFLDKRTIVIQGQHVPRGLIQWEDQPTIDASWENFFDFKEAYPTFNLEDKVSLAEGKCCNLQAHQ